MNDETKQRISGALTDLAEIIDRLRSPGGCPWDREQTERSMAPHLLEEVYESIEAIEDGDALAAREELGDVLINVMMIARIASEQDAYDIAQIAGSAREKLIRRHPHVFGDAVVDSADEVLDRWEAIKRREGAPTSAEADSEPKRRVLDGLPRSLPALRKAQRAGEKAARVGFDWPDAAGPRAKIDEEIRELDAALTASPSDPAAVASEFGDVLFAIVNLARHHGVDAETALHGTFERFRSRFAHVEDSLGDRLESAVFEELDSAWEAAKRLERS